MRTLHVHPANFDYVDSKWKPLKTNIPVPKEDDPKELGYGGRKYQVRCFEKFKGKHRTIFIAPTGSGKSLVQVFNAAREIMESNYRQKQVFIVPQLNIGEGFTDFRHKRLKINGEIYEWEVTVNCCADSSESVKRIKKFLLEDMTYKGYLANKRLGGCTAVVSYSALLIAFNSMTKQEKLRAIANTSFRPDEVHHISGVDEGGVDANRLGEFCKFVLDNNGSLHLTTATFFRGDRQAILANHYMEEFTTYRVQFLEHWKTTGLRELHQNYNCYADAYDLLDQILKAVAAEPDQPPIIIVPADGQKFFKHVNKWEWVSKLVKGLTDIYGEHKVLDLVSQSKQKSHKKKLVEKEQNFCAVVTCAIGREGTDWPACSRVYNTVLDANVLQPIQKLGRALRGNPGKEDVKMTNYIEYFGEWDDKPEVIREKLSDRFNAVVAASMLDDMFYPILMPTLPKKTEEGEEIEDETDEIKYVTLEEVYGSMRNELIDDMLRRIMAIPVEHQSAEAIDEIIDDIIDEYEEDMLENVSTEEIKQRLLQEVVRRKNPNKPSLRMKGIIVDFIRKHGWDKVYQEYVADRSPFIGNATTKDLEELHKFLNNNDEEWSKKIAEAQKIGLKNLKPGDPLRHFMLRQKRIYNKMMKG
jgi:hypothetical protein